MAENSKIEWTEATWNPVTGCTKVSPGCDHCYAERIVERFKGKGAFEKVTLNAERLGAPLRWRKPRRVFVNSMSDLFHDDVPDCFIADVWDVMRRTPQHTYQILTKRHGRMRSLLNSWTPITGTPPWAFAGPWPLPNVWLGVSVEDQKWADIRIPALLDTPAAVRFLSCEPLLGPIDLRQSLARWNPGDDQPWKGNRLPARDVLHWVIVGGESGPGARPMQPGWARSLRDQCAEAGVPFFFKQWGEWAPNGWRGIGRFVGREQLVGPRLDDMGHREVIERVGKKAAGRELDGRTHDEYPETAEVVHHA